MANILLHVFCAKCIFFIVSPMDYSSVTTTLPFAACDDMSCENVTIIDD